MLCRAAAALPACAPHMVSATACQQQRGLGGPAALRGGVHRRPACAATFNLRARTHRPRRSASRLTVHAFTSGSDAAKKALEALQQEHGKPSDREVAAAATAAMAGAAASFKHSKTALGYLFREAPFRTWIPLLACAASAVAGLITGHRRMVWAAAGGALAFALAVWQVRDCEGAQRPAPCLAGLPPA